MAAFYEVQAAPFRRRITGYGQAVSPGICLHMRTVFLLLASNLFMTVAWYGHLKFRETALWKTILISWGIAFFEYCLQVPANRIGSQTFSPAQLKVMQEVITLAVFGVFAAFYFGERFHWNHAVAAGCLVGGAFFMFHKF